MAGGWATSSEGGPFSFRSNRRHAGNKLGQATRTLCRTGSGKHKPARSGTHRLHGISQLAHSTRHATPFPDQACSMQSHTEMHVREETALARFRAKHPEAVLA